ncbi:AfsR/SARP family transcriptional regulator [Actinomadura sp. WMMA1423]|uniref:AfsR/SARP family transcriptional regulator n=1 Tax=Actinomadura sp. WMMA1423 TaxID=2591108 RepID=UPI001147505E|nr:AfsR/SARP family transcriptional regulator [Actinomadura sp. WMMA1423]
MEGDFERGSGAAAGIPRFRVLGPLEVTDAAGAPVVVGSAKLRALLTLLIADANRVVSVDRLVDRLWAGEPPASAVGTLQVYISQARRLLDPSRRARTGTGAIVTRPPGYLLSAAEGEVDTELFAALVAGGERLVERADHPAALEAADRALALWRGRPFADVAEDPDLAGHAEALAELRLRALDCRAAALLGCGRPETAAATAETLVREQPLRERYWARLMLAAYRDGRQADALQAYQDCRRLLDEELGLVPGPELADLQSAILRRDPSLGEVATATPVPDAVPARKSASALEARTPPDVSRPVPSGSTGRTPRAAGQAAPQQDERAADAVPGLVGRERELGELRAGIEAARRGTGTMVLLEGEAGIGKTTLAEAAARLARERHMDVVWARAVEDLGAPPFWLWEQVLQELGVERPAFAGGARDRPAGRAGDRGAAGTQDLAIERFRLLEAIARAVVEAARTGPLLLVLDDLQWADAGSLQALRLLIGRLRGLPCGIVATCRSTDALDPAALEDTLALLGRERAVHRLPLSGLSVPEIETLLGGHGDGLPDAAAVRERTGGNPFFLAELLRFHDDADGRSRAQVPATVRDVVERRFERLPEHTRVLVRLAALAGAEIDVGILAHAVRMDPAQVVTALEPALDSGLLRHDEETWKWRFVHDISREALSARLAPGERTQLHALLADAIEAVHGGEGRLDDLARHRFHAAGGTASEPAFRTCSRAADEARRKLAFDQAARHRERALAVLPPGGDGQDRRYRTLITLVEELRLSGDVRGADRVLDEAVEIARRAGDRERLADAVSILGGVTLWNWRAYGTVDSGFAALLRELIAETRDPRRRAELLGTLAVELYYGPDRPEGERLAEEAVEIARRIGDPELRGRTLNNYVIAAWVPEREPARIAALEESLALAGAGLPAVTEVIARMHLLSAHLKFGRIAEYEDGLERSGRMVQSLGILELELQHTYQQAGYAILRGDDETALELIEQADRQHRRTSVWGAQWARLMQLTVLDRARGRVPGRLDELLAAAPHPENAALRPTAVLALLDAGEQERARHLLLRWSLDRVPREQTWASDFEHGQLGEIAAVLGTPDPAAMYRLLYPYRDRLQVVGSALACAGSNHAVLAKLAERLGRPDAAAEHLARAAEAPGLRPR